jgi:hypothetical protein
VVALVWYLTLLWEWQVVVMVFESCSVSPWQQTVVVPESCLQW